MRILNASDTIPISANYFADDNLSFKQNGEYIETYTDGYTLYKSDLFDSMKDISFNKYSFFGLTSGYNITDLILDSVATVDTIGSFTFYTTLDTSNVVGVNSVYEFELVPLSSDFAVKYTFEHVEDIDGIPYYKVGYRDKVLTIDTNGEMILDNFTDSNAQVFAIQGCPMIYNSIRLVNKNGDHVQLNGYDTGYVSSNGTDFTRLTNYYRHASSKPSTTYFNSDAITNGDEFTVIADVYGDSSVGDYNTFFQYGNWGDAKTDGSAGDGTFAFQRRPAPNTELYCRMDFTGGYAIFDQADGIFRDTWGWQATNNMHFVIEGYFYDWGQTTAIDTTAGTFINNQDGYWIDGSLTLRLDPNSLSSKEIYLTGRPLGDPTWQSNIVTSGTNIYDGGYHKLEVSIQNENIRIWVDDVLGLNYDFTYTAGSCLWSSNGICVMGVNKTGINQNSHGDIRRIQYDDDYYDIEWLAPQYISSSKIWPSFDGLYEASITPTSAAVSHNTKTSEKNRQVNLGQVFDNNWHNIAFVFDHGACSGFTDGELYDTENITYPPGDTNGLFCRLYDNLWYQVLGTVNSTYTPVSRLVIYNRALDTEELYKALKAEEYTDPLILATWADTTSGTTVKNYGISGGDGTLTSINIPNSADYYNDTTLVDTDPSGYLVYGSRLSTTLSGYQTPNRWVRYNNFYAPIYSDLLSVLEIDEENTIYDVKTNLVLTAPVENLIVNGSSATLPLDIIPTKNFKTISYEQSIIPTSGISGTDLIDFREYNRIFTGGNRTEGYSNINLSFESDYSSVLEFKADEYTYFHIPTNFTSISIQDAGFEYAGAFAGSIPEFSDRIYKKLANYEDTLWWGGGTNNGIQDGTWLCAWLKSQEIIKDNGYRLQLDGVNDKVQFPMPSVSAGDIKTMCAWVKFDALSGSQEILSKSKSGDGFELLLFNNNLSVFFMGSYGDLNINYPYSQLETDRWYHLAATHNGPSSTFELYIDGERVAYAVGQDINDNGGDFYVGSWIAGGRYFYGSVYDVRLYDKQLSEGEINSIICGLEVVPDHLILHAPLQEPSGNVAYDVNGNYDGTYYNFDGRTSPEDYPYETIEDAKWIERYYDPGRITEETALSAEFTEVVEYISFTPNSYPVQDICSTMTIDAGSYYKYYHIGTQGLSNMLESLKGINNDITIIKLINFDTDNVVNDESPNNNDGIINNYEYSSSVALDIGFGTEDYSALLLNKNAEILVNSSESLDVSGDMTLTSWLYSRDWKNDRSATLLSHYYKSGYKLELINHGLYYSYMIPNNTSGDEQFNIIPCDCSTSGDLIVVNEIAGSPTSVAIDSDNYIWSTSYDSSASETKLFKLTAAGTVLESITLEGLNIRQITIIDENSGMLKNENGDLYELDLYSGNISYYGIIPSGNYVYALHDDLSNISSSPAQSLDMFLDGGICKVLDGVLEVDGSEESAFTGFDYVHVCCDENDYFYTTVADTSGIGNIKLYRINRNDSADIVSFGLNDVPDAMNISFLTKEMVNDELVTVIYWIRETDIAKYYIDDRNEMIPLTTISLPTSLNGFIDGDFSGYKFNKRLFSIYGNESSYLKASMILSSGSNIYKEVLTYPVSDFSDNWHFITIVKDTQNNKMTLYIDGENVVSVTIGSDSSILYFAGSALSIGGAIDGSDLLFGKLNISDRAMNGGVSETIIYDENIDDTDVLGLYFSKFNSGNYMRWVINTGTKNYIEDMQYTFKYKKPGIKSQYFNLVIKNFEAIEDSDRSLYEEYIRENIANILPANMKLVNIIWR